MRTASAGTHLLQFTTLLCVCLSAGCLGLIDNGGAGDNNGPNAQPLVATELPPSQFRRLTRIEYNNTVRDLLGDTTNPANEFVDDELSGGFEANAISGISQLQYSQYASAATDIAVRAVAERLDQIVGCDIQDDTCANDFITSFGLRAFRRPLAEDEKERFVLLYQDAKASWSANLAIQLVLEAMLISPQFFFHTEIGEVPDNGAKLTPLTSYEVASRLSYFLWQSMPDDPLFEAAASGTLNTTEALEAQATRMLAEARTSDSIRSFHRQWLNLTTVASATKDATLFPEWNAALGEAMLEETMLFAEHATLTGEGTLKTLLSAPYSFVNGQLAAVYGVNISGDDFQRVDFTSPERAGLLTHLSWLTQTADAAEPSVVFRGKFVREQLLCQHMPPPPPDVDQNADSAERLANPACAGCHLLMDPIGAGFGNYDAIGQFDAGADSPQITVNSPPDGIGTSYASVTELAGAASVSPIVQDCYATQWYRFALRRNEDAVEEPVLNDVHASFGAASGNIKALLSSIIKSDGFRFIGVTPTN